MLYGHGKRGTEGPILVFDDNTPYWDYFAEQIKWLERLVSRNGMSFTAIKALTWGDGALTCKAVIITRH
jgi:hypothetical protein